MTPRAPVLVVAWGDRARGDDAVGPLFAGRLQDSHAPAIAGGALDVIAVPRLHIELIPDLRGRVELWFVDGAVDVPPPGWRVEAVHPAAGDPAAGHHLAPARLLHEFRRAEEAIPPVAFLLTIGGTAFDRGAPLSETASANLAEALAFFDRVVRPDGALD